MPSSAQFNIISTKEEQDSNSKHTVYIISVVSSGCGSIDTDGILVERRYRQFHALNTELLRLFPEEMKNITFPKKKYFESSLKNVVIQERLSQLVQYLTQVVDHVPNVLECAPFQHFFQLHHMKLAVEHLTCNQYDKSYTEYTTALRLSKKLHGCKNQQIWMLCGMVECSRCLSRLEISERDGTECLDLLNYDIDHAALFPLLKVVIELRKTLNIDNARLKNMFTQLQTLSAVDVESMRMLRELCVVPIDRVFNKSYSK